MSSSAPTFGAVVRRRRLELEMTQEALAEAADLHVNHVSFLERGLRTPSLDVVLKLGPALHTTGAELVGEVERVGRAVPPKTGRDQTI